MMKSIVVLAYLILASCAHHPTCGNPEGARVILVGEGSCLVRIRQVTIGSDIKIPPSFKGPGMAAFSLEWVEPSLVGGKIELGHFVLIPSSKELSR